MRRSCLYPSPSYGLFIQFAEQESTHYRAYCIYQWSLIKGISFILTQNINLVTKRKVSYFSCKFEASPMGKYRCTKDGILSHRKSVQSHWAARGNNNVSSNVDPSFPTSLLLKLQCASKSPGELAKMKMLILCIWGEV